MAVVTKKDSTWGFFPKFLFEDLPQLDVGLYEYRTLLGRAKFWKSVSLSDEAEAFADIIRDIGQYQTIFLVGHSMGGLLCMAAIAHLIDSRQEKALSRIGGLMLMATPQIGSQRVATPLSWFAKDFLALKPHGGFVTDLHSTFMNNRVVLDDLRAQTGDIVIPTWAVLGTSDHWVDKLSAGLNIPASRKKSVRGSHKEIVKPATKTSDAYEYVHDRIKQVFTFNGSIVVGTQINRIEDPATSAALQSSLVVLQQAMSLIRELNFKKFDIETNSKRPIESSFWLDEALNPLHNAMSTVHEIYIRTFEELECILDKRESAALNVALQLLMRRHKETSQTRENLQGLRSSVRDLNSVPDEIVSYLRVCEFVFFFSQYYWLEHANAEPII